MRGCVRAVALLAATVLLAGCGDLQNLIEGATRRTVTIHQSISDSTKERGNDYATLMNDQSIAAGQARTAGRISLDDLAEQIDVASRGLGNVRFFISGRFRNFGGGAATVTIYLAPNPESGQAPAPQLICSFGLAPGQTRKLASPEDLNPGADEIDARLKAVLATLDDSLLVLPVVQAQGSGVAVDFLQIATLPFYWSGDEMDPSQYDQYADSVKEIGDGEIKGSVSNLGGDVAEVSLYATDKSDPDAPESTLVGYALLSPGQTAEGSEMLVEGGDEEIKNAFKALLDGRVMAYDYIITSPSPLKVQADNLRVQVNIVVEAQLF
jgi:hypothetical protein